LFFVQLTHLRKYDEVVSAIRVFRERSKQKKTSRKIFVQTCFEEELERIYAAEIDAGDFSTRESNDASYKKFVRTKRGNMLDYADAFLRYLRATTLVTIEKRTFHLIIAPSKRDEVEFILANTPREPIAFAGEKEFKEYLFSATNVPLLVDDEALLLAKLVRLGKPIRKGELHLEELKDVLERTESQLLAQRIEQVSAELKDFREYDDIISVFDQIRRKEVPDPALFLEWNVWRSLVMLNYAVRTDGNFVMDLDGMPVNTAPGKVPDIEVDYGDFGMIVEVTTSTGQKQYEMEGEPVARHYGKAQEMKKNMYCLFIAPAISEGTLAHYFNLNRMNTKHYGGKTRIVPLTVTQFVEFLAIARELQFSDPNKVERWLNSACAFNQKCEDEMVWQQYIATSMKTWAA
ncbi:MAG: AlwI family type II restriction endonuclease, partial [Flavobacteriales bacterium]